MAFHKTNFGAFGERLPANVNGYVPEATDGPWDLSYDHPERTHRKDGTLTEYGEWWEREGFPEWQAAAVAATERAEAALSRWWRQNA